MTKCKHLLTKNTNRSFFPNIKNVIYSLILFQKRCFFSFLEIPCSLKNDTAQMFLGLFAEINDVKSVIVGLAQGRAESDKYTTRYHYDTYLFFFHKRNENFFHKPYIIFKNAAQAHKALALENFRPY